MLLKNTYSRAKLVKLKVPVIIQDPDSSRIGAIVWNYTVREENKGQMVVAFTQSLVLALNTNIQGFAVGLLVR